MGYQRIKEGHNYKEENTHRPEETKEDGGGLAEKENKQEQQLSPL